MKELVRFNEALKSNESMQNDIKAMGNNMEEIVGYAKGKGFRFELADVEKLKNKNQALSDDDLDTVAGGSMASMATVLSDTIARVIFVY